MRASTVFTMCSAEEQRDDSSARAGSVLGSAPASGLGSADHARWFALLYAQLRALAQSQLEGERASHTLSATALVSEVYVKLTKGDGAAQPELHGSAPLRERGVFFGLAAQAMRRILVDHARSRGRTKRGGGVRIQGGDMLADVQMQEAESPTEAALDPIDLDAALTKLAIEHGAGADGLVQDCVKSGTPQVAGERGVHGALVVPLADLRLRQTGRDAQRRRERAGGPPTRRG